MVVVPDEEAFQEVEPTGRFGRYAAVLGSAPCLRQDGVPRVGPGGGHRGGVEPGAPARAAPRHGRAPPRRGAPSPLPPPRPYHRLPQGLARPRRRRAQLHNLGLQLGEPPRRRSRSGRGRSSRAGRPPPSTPTTPASSTATLIAAKSSSTATPAILDRDEGNSRIQYFAEIANFLGIMQSDSYIWCARS